MALDMPLTLHYADSHSGIYCSSPEEGYASVNSTSPMRDINHGEHNVLNTRHSHRHDESPPVTRRRNTGSKIKGSDDPPTPVSSRDDGPTDGDSADHYDSVMQWLNQQACGGTVKRKRKINKQQRVAANMRERRRMTSLNTAFERLKETIPIFPYEKKLSRIQTLRLAIDYIGFMGNILHQPTDNTESETLAQHQSDNMNLNDTRQSPDSTSTLHMSPDCIQKFWH